MNHITTSTYHEFILEGISSLRQGLKISKNSFESDSPLEMQEGIFGEMYCRYSFLMIANSLEAAANALILSQYKELYKDIEKLATLLKFQLFCKSYGKLLISGDHRYSRIKEIIACRNEFVHPKPAKTEFVSNGITLNPELKIKKTGERQYPYYFPELKPFHVLQALEDTLAFISFVCFDVCQLKIDEGTLMLGFGSYSATSDLNYIELEYNRKFDKRSFGKNI